MAFEFSITDLERRATMAADKRINLKLRDAFNALDDNDYQVKMREATQEITGYEGVEIYDADDAVYLQDGYFGGSLPVWLPLYFQKVGNIKEDLLLRNAIVTVSQSRKIVTTDVQGLDGTVKEYINNGDYELTVQGTLALPGQNFPKDMINELRAYMEARQSIPIISSYLNSMQVYDIVITSWNLQWAGFINAIPYKFTALSDKPIELTIKEED